MGGVRQQFSTAAEVRLAQASIRFFEELGPPLFEQVGYLFPRDHRGGLAGLRSGASCRRSSACPSSASTRPSSTACAPTTCSAR
jgi:hypothetical protein